MATWYPLNSCPGQPAQACEIECDGAGLALRKFNRLCPFHAAQRGQLAGDGELYDVLVQGERVREAARWAVKLELKLDKEHPGVPFTVGQDGNFTLDLDALGLPLTVADKARAQAAAQAAVAQVRRPPGVRTIAVL